VSPDDLAEIVQALARHREKISEIIDDPPPTRTSYEQKNELNNMSPDYAREQRQKYLKDSSQIMKFLAAPENSELLKMYESVVMNFS
jgi:hypothetical protein